MEMDKALGAQRTAHATDSRTVCAVEAIDFAAGVLAAGGGAVLMGHYLR